MPNLQDLAYLYIRNSLVKEIGTSIYFFAKK